MNFNPILNDLNEFEIHPKYLRLTEQQPGKLTGKATTGAETSAQLGNVCIAMESRQLPQQHTLYQILTLTERCAIKSLPCLQHKWHYTTKTLNLQHDVHTDRTGDCACRSAASPPTLRMCGYSAVCRKQGCRLRNAS